MIERDLSHIVLVHYREVKSIRTSFNLVKDTEEVIPHSNETGDLAPTPEIQNSISSSSNPSDFLMHSEAIDAASLNTAQASEFKNAKSDIQQMYLQAKHRWLRPKEIFEILQNNEKYHISSELANTPPGGSLFLFNKKRLRNFRKDGHNWRKRKDGKTVTEGNEKLKVGNVNVLHCYYAHGEENKNFQRRIYSMIEGDLSHIVLVHYREVKTSEGSSNWPMDQSLQSHAEYNITTKFDEGADTTDLLKSLGPFLMDSDKQNDLQFRLSNTDTISKRNDSIEGKTDHPSAVKPLLGFDDGLKKLDSFNRWMNKELEDVDEPQMQSSFGAYRDTSESENEVDESSVPLQVADTTDLLKFLGPFLMDSDKQNDLQFRLSNTDTISKRNDSIEGKTDHPSAVKPLLGFDDGLKKLDSFNRWMNKELQDVDEPQMQSSSGAYRDTSESENEVDESSVPLQVRWDSYMLGPSLSHDHLFSIVDFSPNWAYENSEIKVLITGKFLKSQHAESCKWSCMFGEVEVPAEVIADGVLRCYTPIHKAGRVPFYVTCSNRLACSEVREFEYRVAQIQDVDSKDYYSDCSNETLSMRFGKLLSLSSTSPNCDSASTAENSELTAKITSMLKNDNDEWDKMLQLTSDEDFSLERVEDQLLQQLLKEKLHAWLLQKLAAGGKGPSVLDEGGQGVLHFGAALGYDWVLLPTITAGVSVNFRDVKGWTALHWAAFCGRERTVASLISLGAAPGALTDPTTKYPSGETPADLASEQGHKGIAGYLAESALSAHHESLNFDLKNGNSAETSGTKAVSGSSRDGELTDGLSLWDSLTAVCNATQAAARIHQVFRVQSFRRKQLKEYDVDKFGFSDERALSLIALKSHEAGKRDEHVDAAAVRIQNKFRSWKGRKDYLIIRQRIVKLQAHVRGHQLRKYLVWSVRIVEKIILRWRRKGSGLRGVKPEPVTEGSSMQVSSTKDDDYDLLKEGRKQTEERLQKALARVKSMVQYPEARDQYHRLLNVVTGTQETKSCRDVVTEIQETKVTLVDVENGSLQKKAMEINCLSDSISTLVSSTFKSQQENCVKVDMKSFDPTNGLNELSENRIGVLQDRVIGKLNSQIGVFTLKVLRPTYDCELLSFIFTKSTLPDDQSYILVKTNTNFLTRHMVWSLQPDGWLGGDVIDVFAEYLWLGSSKHHFYFPTLFSQKVDIDIGGRSKTDMDPTEFAKCTRKVFGLKKFDEHISQCKKIFVPLHDVNHWYLLVVHIDSQVAEIWDSLNHTPGRFNRCQHVLKALDILYDKVEFQLQKENKFSDYGLCEPVQCPRQVGGSDCGVYVVRHMQRYGKEWWHQVFRLTGAEDGSCYYARKKYI
ncbi:calmodulin-binding transcription activator 3-like [Rosa rugosa]|uniref:calmodulin-binding transcription activator 3-like n=1 Tax=Rosa rugosa TaxID=74645 RepID=UPI002B4167EE|nr:calmodulin-binding transcription activator 3-like [Rosa rugosa]